MIKLGNYASEKDAQERLKENELKLLRTNLLNLICEIEETLQPDVVDICDTYEFIKKDDKEFAEKLWKNYLCNSDRIDINSYFGFCSRDFGDRFYFHIVATRYGVGCYYDANKNQFKKDDWMHPYDIKEGLRNDGMGYTKRQLECLVDTAQKFIAYFPSYRDGFFKCVSERKVNGNNKNYIVEAE